MSIWTAKVMVVSALFLGACKKENPTPNEPTPKSGTVVVNLEHKWGTSGANFSLNNPLIHPMSNDTLTFTTMKYYVSNLKLKLADGSWWIHPESYFLVDASNVASTKLQLPNVPIGQYVALEYTMGVDSLRNVSGAQSGALSTTNGMFWSWNSGYIMVKAEGISSNSPTGSFSYHLGGFKGANNVVTQKLAEFNAGSLVVSENKSSEIHMTANVARLFHSYGSVSNGATIHMPSANSKAMASDFYNGILFDHIHN
jgi:hypothetical protein